MNRIAAAFAALCLLATALVVPAALAQEYPSRPIRIIVPLAPGGGTDMFSRTIADHLARKFRQPVIVENKPGANTAIGHHAIATAAPDGYTFGMITSSSTVLPATMKGFTTNPVKDFTPITQLVVGNYALVVHPSVPVKTVGELIAYAKANPGKLNFGSSGGSNDLLISLFKSRAGVDVAAVSYKGIAPARQALLANEIQVTLDVVGVAKEMSAAGRMKFLAVTGGRRDPVVPEIPTVAESGLPGFAADFWFGYAGPAGMPADAVKKLHEGIAEALRSEVLLNQIRTNGNIPIGNTPEEFGRIIAADTALWANAAKAAGVVPE